MLMQVDCPYQIESLRITFAPIFGVFKCIVEQIIAREKFHTIVHVHKRKTITILTIGAVTNTIHQWTLSTILVQ